jgi:hypothetical protein
LKNWQRELAIAREGEHLLNSSAPSGPTGLASIV